jgi:hypothetical protein
MKIKTWKSTLRITINILILVLALFPISSNFISIQEELEVWRSNYVWNNLELAISVMPVIILWILVQLISGTIIKFMATLFAIILSAINFVHSIQATLLLSPDFIPKIGTYVLVIVFPLLIVYSLVEVRRMINESTEVIDKNGS